MKLKDKVFIITGATGGMGSAISLELAKQGALLVLSGRNNQKGTKLTNKINSSGEQSVFLQGDIGELSCNRDLVQLAINTFGRIDGIVTNAGQLGLGSVTELDPEIWNRTFRTNTDSVFYLLKFALPEMLKNEKGVVVINSSIAAFKSFPNHPAYCASKAALTALARQMAVDYAPKIRINSIAPGPVDTEFLHDSAKAFPVPDKAVSDAENATLLKRLGTPRDIAKLALFLSCDDSSWITGSNFTIDGGILANG